MRQHRERARRNDGWPSAVTLRDERESMATLILDLPDQDNLPTRDRLLRLNDDEWREQSMPSVGLILEDWLDGRRVYPAPPRPVRAVHHLRRLLDHATPVMIFFILLAVTQAATMLVDAASAGGWSQAIVVDLILRLGSACTITLLPAGVLLWGAAARRSIRLQFAGAVVWSTLPVMAGLGWWMMRRSPGLAGQFGDAPAAAIAVVAVVSCAGPAIVAYGLERARGGRMTPANMARLVAVLTAVTMVANATRWLPSAVAPGGSVLTQIITAWALPLELASLLALAYSCLSAIVDGQAQSRFWQCAAVGAALLAAGALVRIWVGDPFGSGTTSVLASGGWVVAPESASELAGGLLMLLAFATPVWSAARDALGYGRGAPEDIFGWGAEPQPAGSEPIRMSAIVAIAAGADHALAVDEYGHVGAWGDDSVRQSDVPDGLSGVTSVAAGDGFSLALRADGTVVAWGANDLGQTNVPPDLVGVTAIAAGNGFALALVGDGIVVGWGDDRRGEMSVPPALADVVAISAGAYHGLALLRNGTIVAWGDNTCGQLDMPQRLGPATAISAGGDFNLALLADGTVAAWGDRTYGQLDIPEGLANVTAIAAGAFHAVALRADGDVIAWGGGQRRGEAAHPWRLVDFKAVSAGDGFSLAIRAA
ncbi:MAG TPA: hypothetical protein VF337_01300 [Candidatus Limnocylindrales bacterium]